MDHYLFIANVLNLLSYLQTKLLLLRMMLVAASVFLCLFSFNLPTFYIDNFIFNLSFVIINIYLSIPLFKELIPPNFTEEEKEIYKKHFKKYLKAVEFKHLLGNFRRRVYKVSSSVTNRGNGFASLFFVAKMPKQTPCSITLKLGKIPINELKEFSWIGIVEYISLIKTYGSIRKALELNETGIWNVDCHITLSKGFKSPTSARLNMIEDKVSVLDTQAFENSSVDDDDVDFLANDKSKENEVVIYEWDLEALDKIYSHKAYGTSILNGLHAIWLKYSSKIILSGRKYNDTLNKNEGTTGSFHPASANAVNKFRTSSIRLQRKSIPDINKINI